MMREMIVEMGIVEEAVKGLKKVEVNRRGLSQLFDVLSR